MADKKKMTVAEMIAAARKTDSKGGGSSPPAPAASEPAPATPAAPSEAPAAADKPAAAAKDPKKMSVAEMMAAARAEKAAKAAGAPAAAAPAEAAAKPAAKAAPAAATKTKEAPAATATVEKDTTSILAAARKTAKPGPISKSELAAETAAKPAPKKLEVPPMPEKPAYARPRPAAATAAAATDRRGFLAKTLGIFFGSSLAIGFTSLAVTHLLWVLGLARFMFPNVLIEPPTRFKVGFKDEFAPGQVSEKYKAQFGTWIVRYEYEGQPMIFALKTVCTHLGCTPNWLEGEQKFKCPCHGSGFYKDGINFEGPAPRPLERYAIRIADDGQLEVDKSATFHEETGQWADPASYVTI